MNPQQARALVTETFSQPFDQDRFRSFVINLLNHIDETKAQSWNTTYIKTAFKAHVKGYRRLGTYTSPENEKVDVLIVHLTTEAKLERARTAIRNFVAHHLKSRDNKDAALVAFVSPGEGQWRFSYVKMEYTAVANDDRVGVETTLTPARRSSYIVGEGESCHTAQSRFLELLQDTENRPTLAQIENAFSVEAVTKEFFEQYKALFLDLKDEVDRLARKDKKVGSEFAGRNISTAGFAKKLMGQIVFLYFLQKKGWLGVPKGGHWEDGPQNFLRQLHDGKFNAHNNFFNDALEPLFYDTLATDRGHEAWSEAFNCRIPFLNGGLFEPLGGYDWQKTNIMISNSVFSNTKTTREGDTGTGILDVFDRYNFTVNEAEPLEKEVAIDPEMLGKVFENLLEVNERKAKGSYYTPRTIVHYMCQESLINYLHTAVNTPKELTPARSKQGELRSDSELAQFSAKAAVRSDLIPRAELETLIHSGDQASYYEAARVEGTGYARKLPKTIETHARLLDDRLADIAVCDPAIGSGAFPVGMMQEIVRARTALTPYFNDVRDRTPYHFKRHAIQHCLYGVDIDPGAVEIAKLRLWLSLVVDEDDVKQIKPLPNLDYKIVTGNSLLGVEKNLFNADLFKRLEELKPRYFDATDRKDKEDFKHEIGLLILELTNGKGAFDFEIYFSEVFHRKDGFDVVIANPPYIGESGQKELFRRTKDGPLEQFYMGKMDYFYFFFHLALNVARARGDIAFITTNYYLTAAGARRLRADFKHRALVRSLINFNELRIFESALGQHNMVTTLRKGTGNDSAHACVTNRTGHASPQVLDRILQWNDEDTRYYEVAQTDLYDGAENYIRLTRERAANDSAMPTLNAILDKVATQGAALGVIANINQGVVSGCDYVSNRNADSLPPNGDWELGDGIFVLDLENPRDKTVFASLPKHERQLLRNFFKNTDIGRYRCEVEPTKKLIYYPAELDRSQFPHIYEHLLRFKGILKARLAKYGEDYHWTALHRPRSETIFTGPKIVVPYRSQENAFAYNATEWFCRSDCYVITQKDPSYVLGYLLALLNSKLYFQWLFHRGKRKGKTLEMFQIPLSEIPIKRLGSEAQQQFARLSGLITAANQTHAQKNLVPLQAQLDEMVYTHYGLTEAEKGIIQAAAG